MMQSPISLSEIKLTLLASGVAYEDLDASLDWAFGNRDIAIRDWVETWNSRHSDIFEMQGTDSIFDCIFRLGRAFFAQNTVVFAKLVDTVKLNLGKNVDNSRTIQEATTEQYKCSITDINKEKE